MVTSYSRAFATTSQKWDKLWDNIIITNKLENIEKEQFAFLARKFSDWLNSPKRDLETFKIIRNLLKEDFYHIFLLSQKWLAFSEFNECKEFNQDFVDKVIEKYWDVLFNKNNF